MQQGQFSAYVTVFGNTNRLARKQIALLPFTSSEDTAVQFEANPSLRLRVKHASFSLLPLTSSCSNAYFHTYVIIDFLADWLVFLLNMVTCGLY